MDQTIKPRKKIGLVAHDNKKADLAEWTRYNQRVVGASPERYRPARRNPSVVAGGSRCVRCRFIIRSSSD
jgi:hypothetical protein